MSGEDDLGNLNWGVLGESETSGPRGRKPLPPAGMEGMQQELGVNWDGECTCSLHISPKFELRRVASSLDLRTGRLVEWMGVGTFSTTTTVTGKYPKVPSNQTQQHRLPMFSLPNYRDDHSTAKQCCSHLTLNYTCFLFANSLLNYFRH